MLPNLAEDLTMPIYTILLTMLILFAQIAFAEEAPLCAINGKELATAEDIIQGVTDQPTCWEAAKLARNCGWGSSIDLQFTAPAFDKCGAAFEASQPKASDRALLTSMQSRCDEEYSQEPGTMYRSMNAYCQLAALEWMVNNFAGQK